MREIKFRAWDKANEILSHVTNIKFWNVGVEIEVLEGVENGKTPVYILMQYTGFVDKNGKEIYEGDILEFGWNKEILANRQTM